MKKLLQTPHHRNALITAILVIILFSVNSFQQLQAQTGIGNYVGVQFPTPFQNLSTTLNPACEPEMNAFATQLMDDYKLFLDKTFQNKSSTSSLLDTAVGKYRELRHNLYTAYYRYYPNQGSYFLSTGTQPGSCQKIVEDTLAEARLLLKQHAIHTSGLKKATAILEKYQVINEQLGSLHQDLLYMKSYLNTFADKLPCYVNTACVKN